jgi:FkbM family methyltransferase
MVSKQVEYVLKALDNKKEGFFVDIGANDGLNGSNSRYLERVLSWQGVCIEPIPDIFEILQKNRQCECHNCAITEENGIFEFMYVKGQRKPNIYIDMLSGLVEKYDEKHLTRIDQEVQKFKGEKILLKVPGYKFNDLIKETEIDYVSIDTEGGELEILQSIDYHKYDIQFFSVENNYQDPDTIQYMIEMGYKHVTDVGQDHIFQKKNNLKNEYCISN